MPHAEVVPPTLRGKSRSISESGQVGNGRLMGGRTQTTAQVSLDYSLRLTFGVRNFMNSRLASDLKSAAQQAVQVIETKGTGHF